ncbi:hypothetical protein F5Y09DRAFT_357634 [Xylaria sp. FL1042]|nr:hypothetical protein F5Y09DRAFT_357634 [Xylaria sp. FL1042]
MASAVADIPVEATDPLAPVGDIPSTSTPPPEIQSKDRRRQRLLCGIQRMTSSPSLPHVGRSRSSSAPYGSRTNLSCVSLAPASSGSVTPGYFSSGNGSFSSSPGLDLPPTEGTEAPLAPRKPTNISSTALAPTKACLPADVTVSRPKSRSNRKYLYDYWSALPDEVKVQILAHLKPKELVRASRVNREFHGFCFDGQLWTSFDASEFYSQIPADSLANIITAAGPFIKDLNLRGCLQIEHYKRAEVLVTACRNLTSASLEGCRNFQRVTLHNLIRSNNKLANLNLASMTAVTNSTCKIISQHCPQLETLNVSWCKHMDSKGIKMIVLGCPKLTDLRASEIRGFDSIDVAKAIFQTNKLQRLVLSGCGDLRDDALKTMIHGLEPEIDILTDRPIVAPRKFRHLDLSRCNELTDRGVKALGHLVPELEGLQLNGCTELTNAALEPIIASTPRLTHLELEELSELTNDILSKHLANAPCATKLEHLSVSYCENLGDAGLLPIFQNCVNLKSADMDNTRAGDLVLTEAAAMVRSRATRTTVRGECPRMGLRLVVFDCNFITWAGIREVMSWNSEVRHASGSLPTYPTEVIGLKCYFGWQQTVEQHMQRVLRGDFAAAARLERKWADYMQAVAEAGTAGTGFRRRRRRAREAQLLHANEEEGGAGGLGRRRARTIAASCAVISISVLSRTLFLVGALGSLVSAQTIEKYGQIVAADASTVPVAAENVNTELVVTDDLLPHLNSLELTNASLLDFADKVESTKNDKRSLFTSCKTFPGDLLWPLEPVWKVFNFLIGHAAIKTVPIRAACYTNTEHYDADKCQEILAHWTESTTHVGDPTSVMSLLFQGKACMPQSGNDSTCDLGGLPSYSVNISTVSQIQLDIYFARNTNTIEFIEHYNGCDYSGLAMKLGAGVEVGELYAAADKYDVSAVGGEFKGVSVTSGCNQGGGHSPLSSLNGIGADQVLSIDMVLRSGHFITADEIHNSDIFWAIPGGGGATFGVVTSMTVKVHPKTVYSGLTFVTSGNDSLANVTTLAFPTALKAHWRRFPEYVPVKGHYGYSSVYVLTAFRAIPGIGFNLAPDFFEYGNFYTPWMKFFPIETVANADMRTGSRLIPANNWEDPALFNQTIAVALEIMQQSALIMYNIVGKSQPDVSNAVNLA